MRALKFYQTGSLDNLRIEEVPMPIPAAGELLVQVKAGAINPSDVKNVQGKMHETTAPRIPGRDFAGTISCCSPLSRGSFSLRTLRGIYIFT
jgi:NADPH:quinone reductase-like Zn-dependent oxidoreductase